MHDRELLQSLAEKTPSELTEQELVDLRARLRESPELRDALADQLQWEEFLVQSLTQVEVTADKVQARRVSPAQGMPLGLLGLVACFALVVFIAGVYVVAAMMRPHGAGQQIAAKDPKTAKPPTTPDPAPGTPMPVDPDVTPDEPPTPETPETPQPMPEVPPVAVPMIVVEPSFVVSIAATSATAKQAPETDLAWGSQRVKLLGGDAAPGFVEYTFDSPRAASAELRLRHADGQAKQVAIILNGQKLAGDVNLDATGGHGPGDLRWTSVGDFPLVKGKNVVRLEGAAGLPRLYGLTWSTPGAIVEYNGAEPRPGGKPWPWAAALAAAGEPPQLADVAFEPFDPRQKLPSRDDLQEWFAPVRDQRTRFDQRNGYGGIMGRIEGIAQLRAPLREDVVLRLSLVDTNDWAWHFFAGEFGVTIAIRDARLVAWSTTREPGAPKPATYALTATDDSRARRTDRDDDAFDVRWRRGEIIVSRGDVELLRAALLDPPTDVYFEGQANFRGLALVKVQSDLPAPFNPWGSPETISPASLDWQGQLRGAAKFTKQPDGSVLFEAERLGDNESSWIAAPLPKKGIFAIELHFDEITAGPGFAYRNDTPPNDEMLRAGLDRRDKQMFYDYRYWEQKIEDDPQLLHNRYPIFAGGGNESIRFFVGPSLVTTWLSPDGVHWAQAPDPRRRDMRDLSHLVLSLPNRVQGARARLRSIVLRELAPVSRLADGALVQKAPFLAVDNFAAWQLGVADSRPADVLLADWRRACAVRMLGAGAPHQLGYTLLDWLLADAQLRGLPPAEERDAIAAATLLADAPDFNIGIEFVNRKLLALGEREAARGEAAPYSFLRRVLLETPIHSSHRFDVVFESLVRHELIARLSAGDAAGVRTLARQLRYLDTPGQVRLTAFADFAAAQFTAGGAPTGKPEWRHPLVEELNKETYNVLAEFQAVVDSNAPQDAARMIAQVDPHIAGGLAPSGSDRQLLVSVPVAFAAAMQRDPKLRAAMQEQFGASAQLRVRQAIGEGNPGAIELATVRYYGTEAAAEAHRWLGDRALSGGQFAVALHHYARAGDTAGPALRGEIAPRARLAAAMLGQDLGQPVTGAVHLGDVRMSAAEFETLITETRQGHQAAPNRVRGRGPEDWGNGPAPAASGFAVERRGRLDGERGGDFQNPWHRHVRQFNIPWVERQISVTIVDKVAYVCNRFHVAAFDLATGARKWHRQPPGEFGGVGKANEWPLVPMKPLVTEQFIFTRLLSPRGPALVALNRETGDWLWHAPAADGEMIVSDPLLHHDTLLAFTVRQPDQGDALLRLSQYDSRTGQLIGHTPLTQLRETWRDRRMCEPTPLDDGIVANMGGAVLCCDWSGRLRWIRRALVLPAEEEPRWVAQYFDRPLLVDGRLLIAQPGVRSIESIDPETGSLHWRTFLPTIQRLLGVVDSRAIVRTDEGLLALDLKSGAILWRAPIANLLEGQLCGGPGEIVVSRRVTAPRNVARGLPELVWLAAATGNIVAQAPLSELEEAQPRFGPLVTDGGKLFAFSGREPDDAFRDFIELVPKAAADKPSTVASPVLAATAYALPPALPQVVRDQLPGWNLGASEPGDPWGLVGELQGETGVVALRGRNTAPAILLRTLGEGEKAAKVRVRFGCDPNQVYSLSLRRDGAVVAKLDVTAQSHPNFWKDWEVALPTAAAPGVELMLVAEPTNAGGVAPIYWKKIEIEP